MKLWIYPTTLGQYPLFVIGFVLFWLLIPVWVLCALFWWKQDSAFILPHIQAIFYNPWDIS